jgi:hypothetical protein
LTVIESQISRSKLLISEECTEFASVEGQISHETTGTVIHEDTLQSCQKALDGCRNCDTKDAPVTLKVLAYLLGIGSSSIGSHVENDILQASSLSNLPMNASASGYWHSSGVNDEVANLPEEVVLSTD